MFPVEHSELLDVEALRRKVDGLAPFQDFYDASHPYVLQALATCDFVWIILFTLWTQSL